MNSTNTTPAIRSSALVWRAATLSAIWCVLVEQRPWEDWPLALAIVIASVLTSMSLRPESGVRLRPFRVLQFIPWFLVQSLNGGVDVARRALSPRMPLLPAIIELPLRAPAGPIRVMLVWIISLLPGTAAIYLGEENVRVHVLDRRIHTVEKLQDLERRVIALFALS